MRQTLLRQSIRHALARGAAIATAPQSARSALALTVLGLLPNHAFAQDAQDAPAQNLETDWAEAGNGRFIEAEDAAALGPALESALLPPFERPARR